MSKPMPELVLYTKKNCSLCEDGKTALEMVCESYCFSFVERDIYEDDTLLETYQLLIPALTLNGELVAYGRLEMEALHKIFTRLGT